MKLKTLTAVLALSAFAVAGGSLAASAQQTDVNVKDRFGNTVASNVETFDWAGTSSGAALGVGEFGTPLALNQTFDFVYQSQLVNFDNAVPGNLVTTAAGGGFAAGQVQYTVAARISETVTAFNVNGPNQTAQFAPTGGTISIFYDDAGAASHPNAIGGGTQADEIAGTGFDDGIEIARFTIISGFSSFTARTDVGTGSGTAQLEFFVTAALDFVDEDFIQGILGSVIELQFDSNLQFPPDVATQFFHVGGSGFYPDTPFDGDLIDPHLNDLLLRVDGTSSFATRVPEPATLGLLGAGLVGVCFALRRRSKAAA